MEFVKGHYDDHRNEIYMYFRNPSSHKIKLSFLSESGSKELNGVEYGLCMDLLQCDNEYFSSIKKFDFINSGETLAATHYFDYDTFQKFTEDQNCNNE
ncbi:MAG: hypothetical protein ACMG6E_06350 [Candidatus Roizmanbacteria bacterium]